MATKLKNYNTINEIQEDELIINKSRFIGKVFPITSPEEAETVIQSLRKEHYKANHVCSAYVLAQEPLQLKASDDGEPSGTAGRPILNVIQKQNLKDVLICVIRYFGGIKLGKGGLVRAYTESASRVLDRSQKYLVEDNDIIVVETEYSFYQGLILELSKHNIKPVSQDFTDMVSLTFEIPVTETDWFIKFIENYTNNNYLAEVIETKPVKKPIDGLGIIK